MAPSTPSTANAPIGGRFRRQERSRTVGDGTWWHGEDTETGDAVEILQVAPARAAAVTDAAVRVQVVGHDRLPQIRQVFHPRKKGDVGHVVTSAVRGRTLAARLQKPLPAAEARRITADVADALAVADRAGVHHGRLGPQDVWLADDGTVTVTGVGLAADLLGMKQTDATAADLRSVTALLYAGLTGRWPTIAGPTDGLPEAPEDEGAPVRPSRLAPDIPEDLDELCVATLTERPIGARSVEELLSRLTPPPAERAAAAGAGLDPAAAGEPTPREPSSTADARPTDDAALSGGNDVDRHHVGPAAALAGAGAAVTARWKRLRDRRQHDDALESAATSADPGVSGNGGSAVRSAESVPVASTGPDPTAAATTERQPHGQTSASTAPVRAGGVVPTAPAEVGAAASEPEAPAAVPNTGRDEAAPVEEPGGRRGPGAMNRAAFAAAGSTVATKATHQMRVAGANAQRMMDQLHPEIPHLTPQEKRSRTRSVFGILGAAIAVLLVLSIISIVTLFHRSQDLAEAFTTPSTTSTAPLPKKQANTPVVLAATAEDPLGDKQENDDQAPNVIDNKPGTTWNSQTYKSPDFGGLKQGVGVMLTLKAAAPIRHLTITQEGEGGTVELRNAPRGTFEGSSPMITGVQMQSPTTVVSLPAHPVAKNVLVWFTQLPKSQQGYRLALRSIKLT